MGIITEVTVWALKSYRDTSITRALKKTPFHLSAERVEMSQAEKLGCLAAMDYHESQCP